MAQGSFSEPLPSRASGATGARPAQDDDTLMASAVRPGRRMLSGFPRAAATAGLGSVLRSHHRAGQVFWLIVTDAEHPDVGNGCALHRVVDAALGHAHRLGGFRDG